MKTDLPEKEDLDEDPSAVPPVISMTKFELEVAQEMFKKEEIKLENDDEADAIWNSDIHHCDPLTLSPKANDEGIKGEALEVFNDISENDLNLEVRNINAEVDIPEEEPRICYTSGSVPKICDLIPVSDNAKYVQELGLTDKRVLSRAVVALKRLGESELSSYMQSKESTYEKTMGFSPVKEGPGSAKDVNVEKVCHKTRVVKSESDHGLPSASRSLPAKNWCHGTEYCCHICGMMFYQATYLIIHIRKDHGKSVEEYRSNFGPLTTKRVDFECQVCGHMVNHDQLVIER